MNTYICMKFRKMKRHCLGSHDSLLFSSILAFPSFLALRTGCTSCHNQSAVWYVSVYFFHYGKLHSADKCQKGLRRNKGRMRVELVSCAVKTPKRMTGFPAILFLHFAPSKLRGAKSLKTELLANQRFHNKT